MMECWSVGMMEGWGRRATLGASPPFVPSPCVFCGYFSYFLLEGRGGRKNWERGREITITITIKITRKDVQD